MNATLGSCVCMCGMYVCMYVCYVMVGMYARYVCMYNWGVCTVFM